MGVLISVKSIFYICIQSKYSKITIHTCSRKCLYSDQQEVLHFFQTAKLRQVGQLLFRNVRDRIRAIGTNMLQTVPLLRLWGRITVRAVEDLSLMERKVWFPIGSFAWHVLPVSQSAVRPAQQPSQSPSNLLCLLCSGFISLAYTFCFHINVLIRRASLLSFSSSVWPALLAAHALQTASVTYQFLHAHLSSLRNSIQASARSQIRWLRTIFWK